MNKVSRKGAKAAKFFMFFLLSLSIKNIKVPPPKAEERVLGAVSLPRSGGSFMFFPAGSAGKNIKSLSELCASA